MSPYKHLLNPSTTEYVGLDIDKASRFGYGEQRCLRFDDRIFHFQIIRSIILFVRKVLEHVMNPKKLLDEIGRVLIPGVAGLSRSHGRQGCITSRMIITAILLLR